MGLYTVGLIHGGGGGGGGAYFQNFTVCPKITTEHINLTPYSVMNVRLAAQVLSTSVSTALKTFGPPEVF